MKRAYSLFEIKAIDESADVWTITGIASTPTPDRAGDVVEPLGAEFALPMPLLWQHDATAPIGNVVAATKTKNGVTFRAEIPKVKEDGALKDRIDEAIQSVKYGLIRGTSVGFKEVEGAIEVLKTGGLRFLKWLWLELSLVTIPANAEASIQTIKSYDRKQRAERDRLIQLLDAWMVRTRDPMLTVFRQRANLAAREAYMKTVEKEAADRNSAKTKKGKGGKKKAGRAE